MVKIAGNFSKIEPKKVLVIGDFMLDKYTTGVVKRISPEAPVSVLKVLNERFMPGGAGNVVLNFLALKAKVVAIGRVGFDDEGEHLKACLEKEGANIKYFLSQKDYPTPVKNRLIASSQQLIRIDNEKNLPLPLILEERVIELLPTIINDVDIIAISDYAKGFLSDKIIKNVIQYAKRLNVPVLVDPKGDDFSKYLGATILKPNLQEAYIAAKCSSNESIEKVAKIIMYRTEVEYLIITMSENGIAVFDKNLKQQNFPAKVKEIKDVTGAGDTVLAMLGVTIANKFSIDIACRFANISASIAIEHIGCAKVTLADLAQRLLEFDAENKIFDETHLFALTEILKGKKFTILGIDSKKGMTTTLFKMINKLSKKQDHGLIIYLADKKPDKEFILLLSSISEVDFIIFQKKNLKSMTKTLKPQEIFLLDQDEMYPLKDIKELLSKKLSQKNDFLKV